MRARWYSRASTGIDTHWTQGAEVVICWDVADCQSPGSTPTCHEPGTSSPKPEGSEVGLKALVMLTHTHHVDTPFWPFETGALYPAPKPKNLSSRALSWSFLPLRHEPVLFAPEHRPLG